MVALVLILPALLAGCSKADGQKGASVTLECIQVCLTMAAPPFVSRTYEDGKALSLFREAIDRAGPMERVLDYGAIFRMIVRGQDGAESSYHLNIANTDSPQNGLLLKLPNTEQGYRIDETTSRKLMELIYDQADSGQFGEEGQ
ncbi:hypothetical protein [Cohnella fermenti]|uniref:Lipoprotein n=1 Tax=Cohnella fermenti TaxID=2565925 RepID=A0A4V3WDQ1_9BACL|nr:hypothetical protein [Cohnella fermenti]THF73043.1 hypothetical protein E6C55_30855 [Cohnella fermenti]